VGLACHQGVQRRAVCLLGFAAGQCRTPYAAALARARARRVQGDVHDLEEDDVGKEFRWLQLVEVGQAVLQPRPRGADGLDGPWVSWRILSPKMIFTLAGRPRSRLSAAIQTAFDLTNASYQQTLIDAAAATLQAGRSSPTRSRCR
jgi:hypothetical protein